MIHACAIRIFSKYIKKNIFQKKCFFEGNSKIYISDEEEEILWNELVTTVLSIKPLMKSKCSDECFLWEFYWWTRLCTKLSFRSNRISFVSDYFLASKELKFESLVFICSIHMSLSQDGCEVKLLFFNGSWFMNTWLTVAVLSKES